MYVFESAYHVAIVEAQTHSVITARGKIESSTCVRGEFSAKFIRLDGRRAD